MPKLLCLFAYVSKNMKSIIYSKSKYIYKLFFAYTMNTFDTGMILVFRYEVKSITG